MNDRPSTNAGLLRAATRASVAVSTGLVAAKLVAWLTTGSVSVLASLLDSVMDTATSLINMFAVNYSLKPPDANHRFGHGKAEALAGLVQAMAITASALYLLYQAAGQLLNPEPLSNLGQGLWIIGLAIVATLCLVSFQRYVIGRTRSTAIAADSLHYVTDLLTNTATLLALYLSSLGWLSVDGWIGLGIGVFVLSSAVRLGYNAVRLLMDEELPEAERAQIIAAAADIADVRELRSWRSGQTPIIQLTLAFPGSMSLEDIDQQAQAVRARVAAIAPDADVTVQPVPTSTQQTLPG